MTLLSGCGAGGTCAGWEPVYIRKDDHFTDKTAKSILKNDEYGAAMHCPAFKPTS